MRDSQPFQGGGILLVQWLDPKPVGVPYPEANHVGWYREHANASQTGQTARYQQALAAGGRPYGEPSAIAIRDDLTIYSFAFRDPDGTTLEWVGPLDPTPNGPPDTVAGPNVNCRDIQQLVPVLQRGPRLRPADPPQPVEAAARHQRLAGRPRPHARGRALDGAHRLRRGDHGAARRQPELGGPARVADPGRLRERRTRRPTTSAPSTWPGRSTASRWSTRSCAAS